MSDAYDPTRPLVTACAACTAVGVRYPVLLAPRYMQPTGDQWLCTNHSRAARGLPKFGRHKSDREQPEPTIDQRARAIASGASFA